MDIAGWDTVSVVSIDRVNDSLAEAGDTLIRAFDYTDGDISVRGEFAPWKIAKGGSMRLLQVHTPITSATISGLPGGRSVEISDVVIGVEIGLKFLPSKDNAEVHELRFDFDERPNGEGVPVYPKGIMSGGDDLDPILAQILPQAIASCIAANAGSINYAFAKIGVAAPSSAAWLAPVNCNWRYMETGNGHGYLAIMAVVTDRPIDKLSDNIDPTILKGDGGAFFVFSNELFHRAVLAPYLQQSFRHGARFAYKANPPRVVMTHKATLPSQKTGKWPFNYVIHPHINAMTFKTENGKLHVAASGRADVSGSYYLDYTHDSRMPFTVNPKTKAVTFAKDPKPSLTHKVSAQNKVMEFLFGWLIRLIAGFMSTAITGLIAGTGSRLTGMTTPPPAVLGWSGVRPFMLSDARLEGNFIFCDRNA